MATKPKKSTKKKKSSRKASYWRSVIDRAWKLPRGKSLKMVIPIGYQPGRIRAAASWAAKASGKPVSVRIIKGCAYLTKKA